MTDKDKLKDIIKDAGMTVTAVADKIGITRESFYNKLNNETEFKASEIAKIQNLFHLTAVDVDAIFFGTKVE